MIDESSSSERDRFRRAPVTIGVALESVRAEVDGIAAAAVRDPSPRNRIGSHLARNAGRTGADGTDFEETGPGGTELEKTELDGTDPEETEPSGDGPHESGSDGSSGLNRRDGGGS